MQTILIISTPTPNMRSGAFAWELHNPKVGIWFDYFKTPFLALQYWKLLNAPVKVSENPSEWQWFFES